MRLHRRDVLAGALASGCCPAWGLAARSIGAQAYQLFLFSKPRFERQADYDARFVADTAPALLSLPQVQSVQQFRILDRHLAPGTKGYAYVLQVELYSSDLPATLSALRALRERRHLFEQDYLADVVRPGVFYGEGIFVALAPALHKQQPSVAAGRAYSLIFFQNPATDQQTAFNRWFDRQQLPRLLAFADARSVQRFTLAPEQLRDPRAAHAYQYSVRIELISADIERTLDQFQQAHAQGRILAGPQLSNHWADGTFEAVSQQFTPLHSS